jgi:hypothetical protein
MDGTKRKRENSLNTTKKKKFFAKYHKCPRRTATSEEWSGGSGIGFAEMGARY